MGYIDKDELRSRLRRSGPYIMDNFQLKDVFDIIDEMIDNINYIRMNTHIDLSAKDKSKN